MILNKEIIYFLRRQSIVKLFYFVFDTFIRAAKKYLRNEKLSNIRNTTLKCDIKYSYLSKVSIEPSLINKEKASYLFKMYSEHRFNLLGSGWVKNTYSSVGLGVEGNIYNMNLNIDEFDKNGKWLNLVLNENDLSHSMQIWQLISDELYAPIDWQKDHKYNFRWSQKLPYSKQRQLTKQGADIKVPWELSRMQHLPQMASFALAFPEMRKSILKEFRNHIIDFIASNPYGMGVNWNCAMDVGIRAANILVALVLLKKIDADKILEPKFHDLLAKAMYEHGKFIVSHLEYSVLITSNHYLSDICGLLFISSYLSKSDEINCWLAFSVQEFFNEFDKQFNQDGSNFESSTSYHKLSGELVTYSLSLIKGLGEEKRNTLFSYKPKCWTNRPLLNSIKRQRWRNGFEFIKDFDYKLIKILQFDKSITKPNGEIIQIGDNDSGKLFSFTPRGVFMTANEAENKYENLYGYTKLISDYDESPDCHFWDESNLNHQSLKDAIVGLIADSHNNASLEGIITNTLCNNNLFSKSKYIISDIKLEFMDLGTFSFQKQKSFRFKRPINLLSLEQHFYPDFGIYIFRNSRLFAGIYTGAVVPYGIEAHSHNDKLSVFLTIDGVDMLTDPGTYLYTPVPSERNKFRSSFSHNVPIHKNEEQEDLTYGLFQLINHSKTSILEMTKESISVLYHNKSIKHVRTIRIEAEQLVVIDESNTDFKQNFTNEEFMFSNGYGKKLNMLK